MQNRWILGIGILVILLAVPAGAMVMTGTALADGDNMTVIYLTQENAGSLSVSPVDIVLSNVTTDASGNVTRGAFVTATATEMSGLITVTSLSHGGAEYGVNTVTVTTGTYLPANNLSFSTASLRSAFYRQTVLAGAKETWVDLTCPISCAALDLMIYAPDATLGPFNDTADGRLDNRIFMNVAGEENVTPGDWYYRVSNSGENVTPYTLNTYTS